MERREWGLQDMTGETGQNPSVAGTEQVLNVYLSNDWMREMTASDTGCCYFVCLFIAVAKGEDF